MVETNMAKNLSIEMNKIKAAQYSIGIAEPRKYSGIVGTAENILVVW